MGPGCAEIPAEQKPHAPKLILQPLDKFPSASTDSLKVLFSDIFEDVVVAEPVQFPKMAWYEPRKRYRADSLLKYFHPQVPRGCTQLLLSAKDISATKGKHVDFGIMGLALISGNVGVISTFRLKAERQMEQLKKLALHELGHTAGLSHCSESRCLLHDAEGRNRFDEEDEICPKCLGFLRSVGWKISASIIN
jgi:archaemetzincin